MGTTTIFRVVCVPCQEGWAAGKGGLLSLDSMGDRPTPEGLDHLKGPWHISYREPCGRQGWKEAHN